MPYEKLADLPDEVKGMPKHAQEIWMAAFNSAFEQYDDEEKAFATAWAAVKQKYEKRGGRWVAKGGEHMDDWIAIFRTGRHTDSAGNTRDWAEEDLDHIVSSYNPADHEAPVVIGHPADNAPAYGWVEGLRREGRMLYAKLKDLVPEFVDMVRRGLFRKRSIALYPDHSLRHVGFLGAMAPAVKGLPDVGFKHGQVATVIEFEDEREGIIEELWKRFMETITSGRFPASFAATEEEKKAQAGRSKRYGIGIKKGGNVTKPSEWGSVPDDDFLDPVNYRYPCPNADQTRAAASYWGKPENKEQYSSGERAVIDRRLEAKKKKFNIGQQAKKPEGGTKMSVKTKIMGIFSKGLESLPDDDPLLQPDEPRSFTEAELKAREEAAAEKARKEEKERVEKEFADKEAKARADRVKAEVHDFVEKMAKEGKVIPAWQKLGLEEFMVSLDAAEEIQFAEGKEKSTRLDWFKGFLEELPKVVTYKEIATGDKDVGDADEEKREQLISQYVEQHKEATYKDAVLAVSKKHPDLFKAKE